jgi:predicted ABC-type transport system involved in lysophospholipase L1 biosynthesis ATPase subunit
MIAVLLDGHDLGALSDADEARLRLVTLGFVFQRFHLLNDLTAMENVECRWTRPGATGRTPRAPRGCSGRSG